MSESRDWTKEPLVLINFLPLVKKLGLDPERKRFSFDEFTKLPALKTLMGEVHALRLRESNPELTREQQELERVNTRLTLFSHILSGEALLIVPPPAVAAQTSGRLPPARCRRRKLRGWSRRTRTPSTARPSLRP